MPTAKIRTIMIGMAKSSISRPTKESSIDVLHAISEIEINIQGFMTVLCPVSSGHCVWLFSFLQPVLISYLPLFALS